MPWTPIRPDCRYGTPFATVKGFLGGSKAMRAWIGKSILIIAAIHTIFGLVVFRSTIAKLFDEGLLNTVNGQPDREFAFWFIACGFFWFPLGWLIDRFEKLSIELPRFFGYALLILGVLAVAIMPASGWWLLFIPSSGMIVRERWRAAVTH